MHCFSVFTSAHDLSILDPKCAFSAQLFACEKTFVDVGEDEAADDEEEDDKQENEGSKEQVHKKIENYI
jgi:hypothetical protein